jgi:hypothetical protein
VINFRPRSYSFRNKKLRFQTASKGRQLLPPRWIIHQVIDNLETLAKHGVHFRREDGAIRQPLGCGSYGAVFWLEGRKALKITSDQTEGPVALAIKEEQDKGEAIFLESFPRIHGVWKLPRPYEGEAVYAILRENVFRPQRQVGIQVAIDDYDDGWSRWFEAAPFSMQAEGLKASIQALRQMQRSRLPQLRHLAKALTAMWNMGLPLTDVHSENIGCSLTEVRDHLMIFDFGCVSISPIPVNAQGKSWSVDPAAVYAGLRRRITKL